MKITVILSLLLAFVSQPLFAQAAADSSEHTFTGNVTVASEYIYRGIGQTNRKPALQGGFDYSHASGFYVGNWNSNISWLSDLSTTAAPISSSLEMDFYAGYKGKTAGDISYDVGLLHYDYPGSYAAGITNPNTNEIYGQLGYGIVAVKYSNSLGDLFGTANSKGSGYLEFNVTYDAGDGASIIGHLGRQSIKNSSALNYTDYKLAYSKDLSNAWKGYNLAVALIGTNANSTLYKNAVSGKDMGATRLLVTFTRNF